eukprot:767097-Hanusia_phi.AAC.2
MYENVDSEGGDLYKVDLTSDKKMRVRGGQGGEGRARGGWKIEDCTLWVGKAELEPGKKRGRGRREGGEEGERLRVCLHQGSIPLVGSRLKSRTRSPPLLPPRLLNFRSLPAPSLLGSNHSQQSLPPSFLLSRFVQALWSASTGVQLYVKRSRPAPLPLPAAAALPGRIPTRTEVIRELEESSAEIQQLRATLVQVKKAMAVLSSL